MNERLKITMLCTVGLMIILGGIHLLALKVGESQADDIQYYFRDDSYLLQYALAYHTADFGDLDSDNTVVPEFLEDMSVSTGVQLLIFAVPPILGVVFFLISGLFGAGGSWTKPPGHLPLAVEPEPEPERPVNQYEAAILAGVEAAERVQPEEAGVEPESERPANQYEDAILAGVKAAERVQRQPEEAGDDDA